VTAAIETVGIVGAGFMGTGIAEAVARAGLQVRLQEPNAAPLDRSRQRLNGSVAKAVDAGKLDAGAAEGLRERVEWTTDLDRLTDCDLVIEAVVEDPTVKGEVFQRLSGLLAPNALIASNTSSIPIAELASWSEHRERVLGLHFFSPAQVMKLVEVVVGIDTGDEAAERASAFVEAIGKHPIRTKARSGFIVNMLLVPYLMAGVRMYEEGFADREAIDEGMRLGCGHPMGPLELADFIGLDVLYAVCDSLYEEFKRPEYAPPPLLKRLVVSGHHGRKTGRGFYEYG
jgi:3-hydroxybutyryl-CoA dehydrogenase